MCVLLRPQVEVRLKPQRGWAGDELKSPMERALTQLRTAAGELRSGSGKTSTLSALTSLERAMNTLETTAEGDMWRVDMHNALRKWAHNACEAAASGGHPRSDSLRFAVSVSTGWGSA